MGKRQAVRRWRRKLLLLVGIVVMVVPAACGTESEGAAESSPTDTSVSDVSVPADDVVEPEGEPPPPPEPPPEPAPPPASAKRASAVVGRVIDGDTIELKNGKHVRLVQIDSPELGDDECFAQKSTTILSAILPAGTRVKLEADPALDNEDGSGRLLRYVHKGKKNVNIVLVRRGAATVWLYEGDRGAYAKRLLKRSEEAMNASRGLWGACPGTLFDPEQAATTDTPPEPAPEPEPADVPSEPPPEPAPEPEPADVPSEPPPEPAPEPEPADVPSEPPPEPAPEPEPADVPSELVAKEQL